LTFGDMVIGLAHIVGTQVSGTAKAVVASILGDEGESADDPLFGVAGLLFRPRAPVEKNAATGTSPEGVMETIFARVGQSLLPLASRDLRINQRKQALQVGELAMVGYGGGQVAIRDASGGAGSVVVVYAPTLNGSGTVTKAHAVTLDPDGNTIQIQHADGPAVFLYTDRAVIKNAGGSVYVEIGPTEIVLNGPVKITGGLVVGNPLTAIPVELAGGVPATLIKGL
jgi:hypothetical protein